MWNRVRICVRKGATAATTFSEPSDHEAKENRITRCRYILNRVAYGSRLAMSTGAFDGID